MRCWNSCSIRRQWHEDIGYFFGLRVFVGPAFGDLKPGFRQVEHSVFTVRVGRSRLRRSRWPLEMISTPTAFEEVVRALMLAAGAVLDNSYLDRDHVQLSDVLQRLGERNQVNRAVRLLRPAYRKI